MAAGARTWSPDRFVSDVERLALGVPARERLFDEAAARLKRTIPFDGACWHTLDPGSGLITQHRLQGLPDRFAVLAHNEYVVEDVNRFVDLARRRRKAATIEEATGGNARSSPRQRDLLAPAGLGPELRCAFVSEGVVWGALILVRRAGASEFERSEVDLIARTSRLFAQAVRRGLVAEAAGPEPARPETVAMVELDATGRLLRASSSADALLAELSGTTPEAALSSPALHALASATRAAGPGEPLPTATVKTPSGSWLVLHGGVIGPRRDGVVSVFVQRAHPMLVAAQLMKAFGLTAREEEVARLGLRGATTAQMAVRLAISPHTVGDHLKSIFDKTGARTRGELAARLFFGEHLPRIERRTRLGDDASFADAPRQPRRAR